MYWDNLPKPLPLNWRVIVRGFVLLRTSLKFIVEFADTSAPPGLPFSANEAPKKPISHDSNRRAFNNWIVCEPFKCIPRTELCRTNTSSSFHPASCFSLRFRPGPEIPSFFTVQKGENKQESLLIHKQIRHVSMK